MEKKGTIRRSRRLRDKERDRRSRDDEVRMSVGDALGLTPSRGKAVNLAEARVLQDARAAAGAWNEHHAHKGRKDKGGRKTKRQSRSHSPQPRTGQKATARDKDQRKKAKSVAGTPMRAFAIRDSLEARERTREVFDSDAEDAEDDDHDMPSLDGSSSNEDAEEAADYESKTPVRERDDKGNADYRLSLIATPASQRAQWEPEDDDFIASEGSVPVDNDDGDYEPSYNDSTESEYGELRRGARMRRVRSEDPEPNPERGEALSSLREGCDDRIFRLPGLDLLVSSLGLTTILAPPGARLLAASYYRI